MILDELAAFARERVDNDIKNVSLAQMKKMAECMPKGNFCFENTLRHGHSVICEIKKASPSKGIISNDFPYLEIAHEYELAGADCISCLTEPKWFKGSDEIFMDIRKNVSIPMLRKDFTVDEYQIYQAKVMGADAVLLICSIISEEKVTDFLNICDSIGLSALVETHNELEIETAIKSGARIIGVNNRNLKDFTVDTSNAAALRKYIPSDKIFVAESGITSPESGTFLYSQGADALLIGEALMKCNNISQFISELKNANKN